MRGTAADALAAAQYGGDSASPRPRLALLAVLRVSLGDHHRRRTATAVVVVGWLLMSLAAGGGMLQYVPQGWPVPLRTWLTFDFTTPYALYAFTEHWAVVAVPLYIAQALGVALLAGMYTLLSPPRRDCGVEWKAGRAARTSGFTALGILAAAGCCSMVTIAAAAVLGSSLAATLTGLPFWAPAAALLMAIGWRAFTLQRACEPQLPHGR